MVAFGFDDNTKGRFYNEVNDEKDGNCINTCDKPRSELLTNSEFIDCTFNYTECFKSGYFKITGVLNRTTSETINRVWMKQTKTGDANSKKIHLASDPLVWYGSNEDLIKDAVDTEDFAAFETYFELPLIGF